MAFPFFKLPREIRNMIYVLAAEDDPPLSTFEIMCPLPPLLDNATWKCRNRIVLDRRAGLSIKRIDYCHVKSFQDNSRALALNPMAYTCQAAFREYVEEYEHLYRRTVPLGLCLVDSCLHSNIKIWELSLADFQDPVVGKMCPEYRTLEDVRSIRLHSFTVSGLMGEPLDLLTYCPTLESLHIVVNAWSIHDTKKRFLSACYRQLDGCRMRHRALRMVEIVWKDGIKVQLDLSPGALTCSYEVAKRMLEDAEADYTRQGGYPRVLLEMKVDELKRLMQVRRGLETTPRDRRNVNIDQRHGSWLKWPILSWLAGAIVWFRPERHGGCF